ncbi:ABC transporter permease [Sinorhizobium meliloti]|uniref:ABC transporter permease n=1 Tax=Rhizobium meliloti TaxID=382 RepID=UPI0006148D1F|nr:ABC transporter permease [Sinorhizobium meliloti]KKA12840.1 ABC transporter permease [Sinorhizobium meliloti]
MTSIAVSGLPAGRGRSRREKFIAEGGIVLTFLVIAAVGTYLLEPRFINRLNILNLLRNFSFLLLPALAQMVVMTTGGFDLSVGAMVAISSVLTATVMLYLSSAAPDMPLALSLAALAACLLVGGVVGFVNGFLVAVLKLSPFMVTLATASIITGATLYYTQGIPIYGVIQQFSDGLGRGQVGGIPIVVMIAVAVTVGLVVLQRQTAFGRHLYAVGSDLRSARLSGVAIVRTTIAAYVIASCLAATTGYLMTARLGSGQGTIGATLALETIAAAVIGGVSLRGGIGRAELVAIAALFLTVTNNAMNLLKVDSRFQTLMLGLILIAALWIERSLSRRK